MEDRDHIDVPLVELAELACRFLDAGAELSEAAALMAKHLGLERLRESAREQFAKAASLGANSGGRKLT
jgi:hypothetical protein